MGNYQYHYCPEGIESRYELLVFNGENIPFIPLTDHYHDCIGRIDKSSALIGQWYFEKNSGLFKWNKWTPFHTFGSCTFTMFTIRVFVGLLKKLDKLKGNLNN